jgi:hypothetical protein
VSTSSRICAFHARRGRPSWETSRRAGRKEAMNPCSARARRPVASCGPLSACRSCWQAVDELAAVNAAAVHGGSRQSQTRSRQRSSTGGSRTRRRATPARVVRGPDAGTQVGQGATVWSASTSSRNSIWSCSADRTQIRPRRTTALPSRSPRDSSRRRGHDDLLAWSLLEALGLVSPQA